MQKNLQKNIVVSVPFVRNIRHSLSIPFISELKKYGNLIIVSPFNFSAEDQEYLKIDGAKFILLDYQPGRIWRLFLGVSDYCRRSGYFGKHTDFGLPYYFKNLAMRFNKSGYFEQLPSLVRFGIYISAIMFKNEYVWKMFEKIIIQAFVAQYKEPKFLGLLEGVTYFQSANWGFQDRILCRMADKYRWKSVLIPYTSDQMYATGHMLRDHDIYAVQSEWEKKLALSLHKIPSHKIRVIGSIWYRNIEYFIDKEGLKQKRSIGSKPKILYAGVSEIFFPRVTEIKSVQLIATKFPNYDVVYCPYSSGESFKNIVKNFTNFENVRVLPFSSTITELSPINQETFREGIKFHIEKLVNVDLLVMSYLTSLSTDISFISKCPLIANFIDEFGILEKRNSDEFPKELMLGEMLSVVISFESLIGSINDILSKKSTKAPVQPYTYWDHEIGLKEAISGVMKNFP